MLPQDWYPNSNFSLVLEHIKDLQVLNLERAENRLDQPHWGIGRYDEVRQYMYTTPLFAGGRFVHMGVDLSGYVNSPVYSFADGEIFEFAHHRATGDYGYAVVVKYQIHGTDIYALYGHLGIKSETCWGTKEIKKGACIGYLGSSEENGGWPPHLHFQLSWEPPVNADMPGVVSMEEREAALVRYPDPRIVLGPIY